MKRYEAEQIIQKVDGLPTVILRPAIVYGIGDLTGLSQTEKTKENNRVGRASDYWISIAGLTSSLFFFACCVQLPASPVRASISPSARRCAFCGAMSFV